MNGTTRYARKRGTWARFVSQDGFSLVELMIAALILAAVSSAAFRFYQGQHQMYVRQTDVADTQQNIRVTMQELTRQIRLSGYGVFGKPPAEISAAGDSLLVRFSDGGSVHEQRYYVQARDDGRRDLVTQVDAGIPQVFAEGIDSVRFVGGGPGAGIKWVSVTIVAEGEHAAVDHAGSGVTADNHVFRRLSSTVTLRNR